MYILHFALKTGGSGQKFSLEGDAEAEYMLANRCERLRGVRRDLTGYITSHGEYRSRPPKASVSEK